MSARREKRRVGSGAEKWYWIVDFVFRHPDGRSERVRKLSPVNSRKGAETYEREMRIAYLARVQEGKESPNDRAERADVTLGVFCDKFLSVCAVNKNKLSEMAAKRQILSNHLKPIFGEVKLRDISAAAIEDYKETKAAEELMPKTINNHLAVLGRLLRVAKGRGLIKEIPEVAPIKIQVRDADFLTFDEAQLLIDTAEGTLKTMVSFLLNTGLRIGELRALQWSDVDLECSRIRVRRNDWYGHEDSPKSGRPRDIPMNSWIAEVMRGYRPDQASGYVFRDSSGVKLGHNSFVRPLWGTCRRAGLRKITWHVLRHSFASHLIMRGVPLRAVADLMGHSTTYVTERYSHLSADIPRQAVEALAWQTNGKPGSEICRVA